jgi:hypothetical protein
MKTGTPNQLHHGTESEITTTTTTDPDPGVSHVSADIVDVLTMRVGCWRPPVHISTVPTAA